MFDWLKRRRDNVPAHDLPEPRELVSRMLQWLSAEAEADASREVLFAQLESRYADDGYTTSLYESLERAVRSDGDVDGALRHAQTWFELIELEGTDWSTHAAALSAIYSDGNATSELYVAIKHHNELR